MRLASAALLLLALLAVCARAQTACFLEGDWTVTNPLGVIELATFNKGDFRYRFVYGSNCNVSLTGTYTTTADANPKVTFTKVDPCKASGSASTCNLSDANVKTYCSLGPHLLQIGEVSTSFAAGGCTNWTMSSGFSAGTSAGPYVYIGSPTYSGSASALAISLAALLLAALALMM